MMAPPAFTGSGDAGGRTAPSGAPSTPDWSKGGAGCDGMAAGGATVTGVESATFGGIGVDGGENRPESSVAASWDTSQAAPGMGAAATSSAALRWLTGAREASAVDGAASGRESATLTGTASVASGAAGGRESSAAGAAIALPRTMAPGSGARGPLDTAAASDG